MKRKNSFLEKFSKVFLLLTVVFALSAAQLLKAQDVEVTVEEFDGKGLLISFPSTNLDSTATLTTTSFMLAGYDYLSFASYPVYWSRLLTSTTGKPRVLSVLKGTNTPSVTTSWQLVDTSSVNADSTETWGNGSMDFNSKKFAYYRWEVTGTAGNRSDTYVQQQIWLPYKKRD